MITRRQFLTSAVTVPFALPAEAERPNIILIMADDLGWGDTGFNGNRIIRTPNLDAMAKDGIRFTRFYSGGPVCSPTRGTCLTGRHYFRYGVCTANTGKLPAEEFTIEKGLKSLGYATGHFGKWHLGTLSRTLSSKKKREPDANYAPPWERDFNETFSTESCVPTWDPTTLGFGEKTPYYENGKLATANLEGDDSRVIMDRVVPFIRRASAGKQPFLAVVWFHAPHEPVVAGPKYREMYRQYSEGEQHYYGCITALDEQVGRLRKELRDLRIERNTMVWFCSDNGPEGKTAEEGEYRGVTGGLRGRKRSLFSGGVNVPALLEWPGRVQRGLSVDLPCSTLDYFPTIREITGFPVPDKPRPIDGVSLLPLLSGKMTKRAEPIVFRFIVPEKNMFGSPTITMVEGRYKFLTNFSQDGNEDMLFDLVADRTEEHNIISRHVTIAESMKKRLRDWVESCKNSHAGADYTTPFTPDEQFPILTGTWPARGRGKEEIEKE